MAYVRGKSGSQRCGRHTARAPSHHVRGVAPVGRVRPLADNAGCRQIVGESPVPQSFPFALHVPSVMDRRMLPLRGLLMAGPQFEGGENSVRRIEMGCHCWLSS
jgi:hypothetical protein